MIRFATALLLILVTNNFAPETFTDTRFVKQLEDSGCIKGLYPKE